MILVDTSIWIDLLSKKPSFKVSEEDYLSFATCGPIIQEILQGLKDPQVSKNLKEIFLALTCLDPNVPCQRYVQAAEIFRLGRSRGYTIRSSVDCLIAAIAIHNDVPVWHRDRDFSNICRFTTLLEQS